MSVISATRSRLPAWPLWAIPLAIAIAISITLVGSGILGLVIAVIGGATGRKIPFTSPGAVIGSTVIMDVAMVGAAFVAARIAEGRLSLSGFGFVPVRVSPGKAVGLALATWGLFLLFTGLWSELVGKAGEQKIIEEFGADRSDLLWVATLLMIGLVAPLAEEVLFRGFFFSVLWRRMPLLPAAVLTGVMFGALHLGGSPVRLLVPLAVLGLLLCLLRAATGSIVPCIAAHALNNSIAYGVGQDVPGGWVALIAVFNVAVTVSIAAAVSRRAYTRVDGGSGPQTAVGGIAPAAAGDRPDGPPPVGPS